MPVPWSRLPHPPMSWPPKQPSALLHSLPFRVSPRPCARHHLRLYRLSRSRHQTNIPQRHGSAVEHVPPVLQNQAEASKFAQAVGKQAKSNAGNENLQKQSQQEVAASLPASGGSRISASDAKADTSNASSQPDNPSESSATTGTLTPSTSPAVTPDTSSQSAPLTSMALEPVTNDRPLETVLHLEPPTTSRGQSQHRRAPHLEAPPYVHHFDTYTLVKNLSKSGFTYDQSVTMMKAVRSLLAANLDMAKDGLVSKSDVENVSLLILITAIPCIMLILHCRSPTSSGRRAPSCVPKSRPVAKWRQTSLVASGRTCNTRSTF